MPIRKQWRKVAFWILFVGVLGYFFFMGANGTLSAIEGWLLFMAGMVAHSLMEGRDEEEDAPAESKETAWPR
jgi:hypothetical protein